MVYGPMGKKRVPLPACAYHAIRYKFKVQMIPMKNSLDMSAMMTEMATLSNRYVTVIYISSKFAKKLIIQCSYKKITSYFLDSWC